MIVFGFLMHFLQSKHLQCKLKSKYRNGRHFDEHASIAKLAGYKLEKTYSNLNPNIGSNMIKHFYTRV